MKSGSPPHQTYPGVSDTAVLFIPMSRFAGSESQGSHRFTVTGEELEAFVPIPDLLVGSRIRVRVLWNVDTGSTADDVTWRVRYAAITPETDAVEVGQTVTALDTAIAADTASATASCLQRTADGVINGGTLSDGDVLKLALELNAVTSLTPSTDNINAFGLELEYTRKQI